MFFSSGRIPAGLHITNGEDGVLQAPVFLLYSPRISAIDEAGFLTFGKRGAPARRGGKKGLCDALDKLSLLALLSTSHEQVAQVAVLKSKPQSVTDERPGFMSL